VPATTGRLTSSIIGARNESSGRSFYKIKALRQSRLLRTRESVFLSTIHKANPQNGGTIGKYEQPYAVGKCAFASATAPEKPPELESSSLPADV